MTSNNAKSNHCWFTRWGLHIILAATIPAIIAKCSIDKASEKIANANLIQSVLPELVANDPYKQRIALYAIEIGINKETSEKLEEILGTNYSKRVLNAISMKDKTAAENLLKESSEVSESVYYNTIKKLKKFDLKDEEMKSIKDDLINLQYVYQPENK